MRHKVPHFTSKPFLLPLPSGKGAGGMGGAQFANSIRIGKGGLTAPARSTL